MKNLGHWMRHHWLKLALVMTASSIVGTQVAAHHAFGAEFDPNRPLILRGPVVKVEWVNPHAWIHMEHTTEAGTKKSGWSRGVRRTPYFDAG